MLDMIFDALNRIEDGTSPLENAKTRKIDDNFAAFVEELCMDKLDVTGLLAEYFDATIENRKIGFFAGIKVATALLKEGFEQH